MTTETFDLTSRAMLVNLSITAWSSNKLDKSATNEVLTNHNAQDTNGGRFTKALVAKAAMADVRRIAAEARQKHYELTAPWTNEARILSTKLYPQYEEAMDSLKAEYEMAVRNFLAIYPDEVEAARGRLGTLFNDTDYPSIIEVERKFTWERKYMPIPKSNDFRLEISNEISDKLKQQYEDSAKQQVKDMNKSLYLRAHALVEHVMVKLDEYGEPTDNDNGRHKTFRSSLITNARDFADLLPSLNVTNDPELNQLSKDIKDKLCEYDSEYLKEDDLIRDRIKSTAKEMVEDIKEKLGGF